MEYEGLSLSASFHRTERYDDEKEREDPRTSSRESDARREDQRVSGRESEARRAENSRGQQHSAFRACTQHRVEKLTLYSSRARCFGCVKCFQEGVLRGHQGQSLQRAQEETKEKLVRQHGILLKQSRTIKENQQVCSAASGLIEQESSSVQCTVKRAVESVKADLQLKSAALAHAVEQWRETKLREADAVAEPLQADIENIDNEVAQLKSWCGEDDDTFLQTFFNTKLADVSTGEDTCKAALAKSESKQLPRIETSHALKSCAAMSFADEDYEEGAYGSMGTGGLAGPRRDMSDAAELDRVAVIALGNTEMDKLTPQDRRLFWKHRVTLTDKKKALLKLLKCAQWDKERQVIPNPKPQTPNPKPQTTNPKPQTQNPNTGALHHDPRPLTVPPSFNLSPEPEASTLKAHGWWLNGTGATAAGARASLGGRRRRGRT